MSGLKINSSIAFAFVGLFFANCMGQSGKTVAVTVDGEPVKACVEVDHGKMLAHSPQDLYIVVRFDIPEFLRPQSKRMPICMGMVIDRSGSMGEKGKIEYARRSANYVVDQLKTTDILGVVEYDDRISTLWPAALVKNPGTIKRMISELEPRGSTNLCGGLMQGIDDIERYASSSRLNRVILLSDGLANRGITDPDEIGRLVRHARANGITVSAMGLGLDYDENLMQAIAENGGGNYYYIESPTQMADIFHQEMNTMIAAVAKDVHIIIDGTDIIDDINVYGYKYEERDGKTDITLEDLYGGEKRSLTLRLKAKPQKPGECNLGSVSLSYTDCEKNTRRTRSFPMTIIATENAGEVAQSENKTVRAEAVLATADEEHSQYVKQYEAGDKQAALANISALQQRISSVNATIKDVRLAKKSEGLALESSEMAAADQSPAAKADYLKSSKQRFYYAQKGKQSFSMLRNGDDGYQVKQLQQKLKDQNLYSGTVDGEFSPEVEKAVEEYQKQNNIPADGVAGPATLKKLDMY